MVLGMMMLLRVLAMVSVVSMEKSLASWSETDQLKEPDSSVSDWCKSEKNTFSHEPVLHSG